MWIFQIFYVDVTIFSAYLTKQFEVVQAHHAAVFKHYGNSRASARAVAAMAEIRGARTGTPVSSKKQPLIDIFWGSALECWIGKISCLRL